MNFGQYVNDIEESHYCMSYIDPSRGTATRPSVIPVLHIIVPALANGYEPCDFVEEVKTSDPDKILISTKYVYRYQEDGVLKVTPMTKYKDVFLCDLNDIELNLLSIILKEEQVRENARFLGRVADIDVGDLI